MSSTGPFIHRFNIALYDVDAAQVIFFGNIFHRAFDAAEAFFRALGYSVPKVLKEREFLFPVVHAESDYLAPLRCGDAVEVEVRVAEVRERSFVMEYLFSVAERLCAKVRIVHAVTDADVSCAQLIPQGFREALLAHANPANRTLGGD